MSARFIPACAGNSSGRPLHLRSITVHPRVCGELRARPQDAGLPLRFIPACAGNSLTRRPPASSSMVHPRVCGELAKMLDSACGRGGSSPRVRGTRILDGRHAHRNRFIPACAGNSHRRSLRNTPTAVHPRVCGELAGDLGGGELDAGSSPRVRGTLDQQALHVGRERFIPACAGNSQARLGGPCCHCGSSPRVRGTRNGAPGAYVASRFIPACAGNSNRPCADPAAKPVHPRVCGELSNGAIPLTYPAGSSPRVRGTHDPGVLAEADQRFIPACAGNSDAGGVADDVHVRFIPACAGNSARACGASANSAVHPRVCGELVSSYSLRSAFNGSSPRVRGTR